VTKHTDNETSWLGLKLFAIGSLVQEKMNITNLAHPYAKLLYEELHEVVNLSVLEIHAVNTPKIVVVHKEESDTQLLKANPAIGKFSECHSSAAGKCLLAFSNQYIVKEQQPFSLAQYTDNTITEWQEFLTEIEKTKKNGYALDEEEREYGLTCIGAPILDRKGVAIAALSIAGPTYRMKDNMQHKIERVMDAARQISMQLV
jgi:DNA-binding IclR family transcriptional regulator